jgi:hypothetical protein
VHVQNAVRDVAEAVALTLDHTPAEVESSGIDAEHEHGTI